MSEYGKYSKAELIRLVEELRAENARLTAGAAAQPAEAGAQSLPGEGAQEGAPARFKEKYAARILESLPDMLTVISDRGTLVDLVSSDETNHVGIPTEELIGLNIREVLTEEAYANVKANLDRVVQTNEGSTSHHDITLEGVTHHYENRIFPLERGYTLCMCRDVTEEVKAKDELLQANRRMTMAEDIATLDHWYYYDKTREFEAPKIFPLLKGSSQDAPARFHRQEFLSYVHPADREKVLGQLRGESGDGSYVEYRLSIGGKTRYFHSRLIHTYHEGDSLIVEGYAQDMTYLVERLHELEAVRYALNNAAEEIYSCNLDGTLEFANRQFAARNRLDGDISQHKIYELPAFTGSGRLWDRLLSRIRQNDGYYQFTTKYKDPAEGIVALDVASYIVYDPAKEKEVVWFFSRDITVRLAHENRVKELNQLMDAILNSVPVCLFVKDPGNEFRYLYWNKAFERDSGIPAAKALGRTDFEIFPDPKDAEKFRQDDLFLLQRGSNISFEEQYQAMSGETRTVFTSKILVPSENKLPLIVGVSWDITDMKNTERELVAARIKAEEADKLKSAFLANMSHEIRTPLNAIMGFSKLILTAGDEQEKQQYSEIIENNSELLLQLINDILDLSKIEAGTLEFNYRPMSLGDLCREQYEIHKARVREGVRLVFEEPQEEIELECDYNRLSQVITNLINNAAKFTARGEIRYGFRRRGERVECFVSDTGCGIPERERRMIFDRFVKLNSHATGTGLGLAITKMIVEKLGGKIGVESEMNRGTTFRFIVPLAPGLREGTRAAESPADPADGTAREEPAERADPQDLGGHRERVVQTGQAVQTAQVARAAQTMPEDRSRAGQEAQAGHEQGQVHGQAQGRADGGTAVQSAGSGVVNTLRDAASEAASEAEAASRAVSEAAVSLQAVSSSAPQGSASQGAVSRTSVSQASSSRTAASQAAASRAAASKAASSLSQTPASGAPPAGSLEDTIAGEEDGRPTVLIAEDIDSNFLLMKAFIGKRFHLVWARNGREAVELFERHRPRLIFMDIKMPVMDGYEATKAIRRLSKEVPILAITAFAFESDRNKALEAGCNGYLTKPISRQALNDKLDFYLGGAREADGKG